MYCKNCQKETKNPSFCSSSCSSSYNNRKINRKIKKARVCKKCESPIERNRAVFCNECLSPPDMTLLEAMYHKHHKSSAFALVRTRARALFKDKPKVCTYCGYNKHVEICHIKAIKDFPLDTLISEVNHPDNLISLCPNCHWEFDHL